MASGSALQKAAIRRKRDLLSTVSDAVRSSSDSDEPNVGWVEGAKSNNAGMSGEDLANRLSEYIPTQIDALRRYNEAQSPGEELSVDIGTIGRMPFLGKDKNLPFLKSLAGDDRKMDPVDLFGAFEPSSPTSSVYQKPLEEDRNKELWNVYSSGWSGLDPAQQADLYMGMQENEYWDNNLDEGQRKDDEYWKSKGYDPDNPEQNRSGYDDVVNEEIGDSVVLLNADPLVAQSVEDSTGKKVMNNAEFGSVEQKALDRKREQSVNDGTLDYNNIHARDVLGSVLIDQYEHDPSLIGSMDPNLIDPTKSYDQLSLYKDYGRIPNVDRETLDRWQWEDVKYAPTMMYNEFANMRTNLFDYGVEYGGKSYSGHEFDRRSVPYVSQIMDSAEKNSDTFQSTIGREYDPNTMSVRGFVPKTSKKWRITMEDGSNIDIPIDAIEGKVMNQDGTIGLLLSDGRTYDFSDVDSMNASVSAVIEDANEGDVIGMWEPIDMQMENGDTLSYDDVLNIMYGEGDGNDKPEFDFGPLNIGKPSRYIEKDSENGITPTSIVDTFIPGSIDMMLGSSPYLTPGMIPGWLIGATNAMLEKDREVYPSSLRFDGTTQRLDNDMSNIDRLSSIGANLLMPATEGLFGRFGGALFGKPIRKGLKKIENKVGRTSVQPWLEYAQPIVGEGFEEVLGNIPEEISNYGISGAFANANVDDDGEKKYTESGYEDRNNATGFLDRFKNFWSPEQAGEAFDAGSLMAFELSPLDFARSVMESKHIHKTNKADKQRGYGRYVPPRYRDIADEFPLSDDTLEKWK